MYGQNLKYTVIAFAVVAFQLEAPMLYTFSVVAHIECVTGAHMLKMHPRVNICLSDCSP